MATKQTEIPGTERNYTKAMREKADKVQTAIRAHSKAGSKRKEAEIEALDQMERDGLTVYVDTESDPPFKLELNVLKKVKKSAYKPPKPGDGEDDGDAKKLRSVN